MTQRKPAGVTWESWVERQIRESMARGEFDHLAPAGKPIAGLGQAYDEDWWIRDKLKREHVTVLPPALQLRRDVETARQRAAEAPSDEAARAILEDINVRIRYVNAHTVSGPPTDLMPLDIAAELARLRLATPDPDATSSASSQLEP